MRLPCLLLSQCLLPSVAVTCLLETKASGEEMHGGKIEWSLTTPPFEAGPRSFPTLAVHARNRTGSCHHS